MSPANCVVHGTRDFLTCYSRPYYIFKFIFSLHSYLWDLSVDLHLFLYKDNLYKCIHPQLPHSSRWRVDSDFVNIYHPFQFITISSKFVVLCEKTITSPTLLPTHPFGGGNNKKLAQNTILLKNIALHEPILSECSSFLPPENFRKSCVWFAEIFRWQKIGKLA